MQTYSHVLMTVAANQLLSAGARARVRSGALILGSFAPDIALGVLTAAYVVNRRLTSPEGALFGSGFDQLYFTDPLWVISHNVLHAPLMIVVLLALGWYFGIRGGRTWGQMLFWFGVGCVLHSAVDILTHHDDGPLLLFPFDWQTRFISPVSYWDRDYGAAIFAPLEHLFDLVLVVFLLMGWRNSRRRVAETTSTDD